MSQGKRTFTMDDLDSVMIDEAAGITTKNASEEQFYQWANAQVATELGAGPWSLRDRVEFFKFLHGIVE